MGLGNGVILYDYNGNPLAQSPGSALAGGQSGLLTLGQDYGSPAAMRAPKIDAQGNQYAVPMVGAVPVPVQVNTVTSTPQNLYGNVSLAWDNLNSRFVPFQVDPTGAGVVRQSLTTTANWSPGALVGTTTTAGRSMMSFFNAGNLVHRVEAVYAMCPPQVNTSGGLAGIGSGTSYTQIFFEMHRMAGHTGGTVVMPGVLDPADSYDITGFTARFGATITGEAAPILCQWDAAYNGSIAVAKRETSNLKAITIPPNSGFHIKCVTNVSANVAFQMRVITSQNTA